MASNRDWLGFKSIPNGTRVYNHFADECVAVANRFHEGVLRAPFVWVGNAKQWWLDYYLLPALYEHYRRADRPVAGALAVWKPSKANGYAGHIGSVLEVYADGTFLTLEQNWGVGAQRWAYRYRRRIEGSLYGFLVPFKNPAGADAPAKPSKPTREVEVIKYRNQNRERRPINKGETLWLTHSSGANRGNKQNCGGKVGEYVLTAHVRGEGFGAGDVLELCYVWENASTGKQSPHYVERVTADRHGLIMANPTFQRALSAGWRIHLRVYAGSKNTKTGTLTVLDSDGSMFLA